MSGSKRLHAMLAASGRNLWSIPCLFSREGRHYILEWGKAITDLQKLAVRQREIEIAFQSAREMVDLLQKVQNIKEPLVRDALSRAILSIERTFSRPGEIQSNNGRNIVQPEKDGPHYAG